MSWRLLTEFENLNDTKIWTMVVRVSLCKMFTLSDKLDCSMIRTNSSLPYGGKEDLV